MLKPLACSPAWTAGLVHLTMQLKPWIRSESGSTSWTPQRISRLSKDSRDFSKDSPLCIFLSFWHGGGSNSSPTANASLSTDQSLQRVCIKTPARSSLPEMCSRLDHSEDIGLFTFQGIWYSWHLGLKKPQLHKQRSSEAPVVSRSVPPQVGT